MNEWDERCLDWDLSPGATIVDVGAFTGTWLGDMMARYTGRFVGFEPQLWAHERIEQNVRPYVPEGSTLEVLPYGLGLANGVFLMGGWETDSNSFLKDADFFEANPGEGRDSMNAGAMIEVDAAFKALHLDAIDVLLMNIEGYEFTLLPEMLRLGLLDRIRYLAVQFHDFADPDRAQETDLRARIGETHHVRFDYGPTVVCWERNPA